jgi:predicted nucleic acid-binding protein
VIIIDSDILIWILRGRADIKDAFVRLVEHVENRLFITPVQMAEIYAGLKDREKIDTSLFLDSFQCLAADAAVGKLAGEYLRLYKKSHGMTMADAVIGACAKIYGMRVWTMNRKHYPMMARDDFVTV